MEWNGMMEMEALRSKMSAVGADEVLVKMKSLPYPDEQRMLSSRLMTVA